ncbi:MAG: hypothetical protein LBK43_03615 [Treponema sp.]|jgi:hypothetical protein|nr:hypothetical protein [Treponema sp.]
MAKEKPEAPPEKGETVKVLFRNTYIGDKGIFYKKNWYTIDKKLAEQLQADIEKTKEA